MVNSQIPKPPEPPALANQQPIRFGLHKSTLVWLAIFVIPASGFCFYLSASVWMHPHSGPRWLIPGYALIGILLLLYVVNHMFQTVELRQWVIDYSGLFGRKQIQIKEVTSIDWGGARGTITLAIRSRRTWIMVSNQCFTEDDLKRITEFIYAGAEATGNAVLKRPIPQVSLKEIPQKSLEEFSKR
jgi:hypothetical protein